MEKPNNIKEIDLKYIIDYVQHQGQYDTQWLKDTAKKEMPPDKNGNPRKITFFELRNDFVKKYMPELLPKPKPKEPTMYELIDAL